MAMALLLAGLIGGFSAGDTEHRRRGRCGPLGPLRQLGRAHRRGRRVPRVRCTAIATPPGSPKPTPLVLLPQEIIHVGGIDEDRHGLGATAGGLAIPAVTSGGRDRGPGQVVADTTAGVAVGDQIEIGATAFRVVGQVTGRDAVGR